MSTVNTTRPLLPSWLESEALLHEKPVGVFFAAAQENPDWFVASPATSLGAARVDLLEREKPESFDPRKTFYFHCDFSRLKLLKVTETGASEELLGKIAAEGKDGYALCLDGETVVEIGLSRNFVRGKKSLFRGFRNMDELRYFVAERVDSLSPQENNAGARFIKSRRDLILREIEKIESERNTLRQLEDFIAEREEHLNRRARELSRRGADFSGAVETEDSIIRPLFWN